MYADGYFQIVDRKRDMILGPGGYNILEPVFNFTFRQVGKREVVSYPHILGYMPDQP